MSTGCGAKPVQNLYKAAWVFSPGGSGSVRVRLKVTPQRFLSRPLLHEDGSRCVMAFNPRVPRSHGNASDHLTGSDQAGDLAGGE